MSKKKNSLLFRIKHIFVHHPWLKVISLILAIAVWMYAREEISRFSF